MGEERTGGRGSLQGPPRPFGLPAEARGRQGAQPCPWADAWEPRLRYRRRGRDASSTLLSFPPRPKGTASLGVRVRGRREGLPGLGPGSGPVTLPSPSPAVHVGAGVTLKVPSPAATPRGITAPTPPSPTLVTLGARAWEPLRGTSLAPGIGPCLFGAVPTLAFDVHPRALADKALEAGLGAEPPARVRTRT